MTLSMVSQCGCESANSFTVKSAGVKNDMKPKCEIPFAARSLGADFQDAKYGKGNRLHNIGGRGTEKKKRCTVCGKQSFA